MARKINVDFDKNSSLFGLFAIAIAVLAIGIVVAKTLFDVIQFNGRVLSKRNEVQSTIQQNIDNSEELLANYQQLSENNLGPEVLFQIMSTEYDFAGFTSIINAIAQSSNVELDKINSATSVESANEISQELNIQPTPFEISLTVRGGYDGIKTFVDNLQQSAQPLEILSLDIGGSNEELSADVRVNAYFQQRIGVEAGEEIVR